jgi:metallo-beta-lactamase family protein
MSKFQFFGAAGTVTGSCHLLENGAQRVLIDCGMFQGPEEIEALNLVPFGFNAPSIDQVLLTHAHLDHSGRLPQLIDQGYRGPIFMTAATRDLIEIALFDLVHINQQEDTGRLPVSNKMVEQVLTQCHTVGYHEPLNLGDYTVTYFDAGHILGSAYITLEQSDSGQIVVMSGDLGNSPQDLIRPTERAKKATTVVLESTYGDRLHGDRDASPVLEAEIEAIIKEEGVLLMPAFSIERTQEILHLIKHLKADGKVPGWLPVYLDSPMAIKVTKTFLQHQYLFNAEFNAHGSNGLTFPGLTLTLKARDSEHIHDKSGPKVIVAGSGMMTGGRILKHAARYLPEQQNRILFVGYQGEETLGREIANGNKEVVIDGLPIHVRAQVTMTDALSAHADQQQLLSWLGAIAGTRQVVLVHGEDGPRRVLSEKITTKHHGIQVHLPQLYDTLDILEKSND